MLDRNSQPAHVIMAKNLADARSGTAPRGKILEEIARGEGFRSWEAFRAAGRRRFLLPGSDGAELEIPPGILKVDFSIPNISGVIFHALRRRGMWGDVVGPVVLHMNDDASQDAAALAVSCHASTIGLLCDGRCGPGRALQVRNDRVLRSLSGLSSGYEGVIYLHPDDEIPEDMIRSVREGWPKATIAVITHRLNPDPVPGESRLSGPTRLSDQSRIILTRPGMQPESIDDTNLDISGNDMWRHRLISLVTGLSRAGFPVGPVTAELSVEDLRNIPPSRSLDGFRDTLPGYSTEGEVVEKCREQLAFLTMQMRFDPKG